MFLGVVFFRFFLSGTHEASWIYGFIVFIKFGENTAIISSNFFLSPHRLLEPNCTYVRPLDVRFPLSVHTFPLSRSFFWGGGLHLQHIEVPGLGVESELQLLAYTPATAMQDPSHVSDLHHSSCWILNPLIVARKGIESSWILAGSISTVPQRELPICHFR